MNYSRNEFNGRRFVVGDIHGGYRAFADVLEKSEFDYQNDLLICLGDVVDGWSESLEVIEELLSMKHVVYIKGNHDVWCIDYYKNGKQPISWLTHGGVATIESIPKNRKDVIEFLDNGLYFYELDECIFSHAGIPMGGFNKKKFDVNICLWDRAMIQNAVALDGRKDRLIPEYKEIYVGHTPVECLTNEQSYLPRKFTNVYAMDTSAAFGGKVTMMDIDSKVIYQSDNVMKYYPNERGRNDWSYSELNNKK